MRGKQKLEEQAVKAFRITPAGAGKTSALRSMCAGLRDHPRRCGENKLDELQTEIDERITPAGAGKTVRAEYHLLQAADHPRRCGENKPCRTAVNQIPGSPPQVRGKHYNRDCGGRAYGITPAGAGKT